MAKQKVLAAAVSPKTFEDFISEAIALDRAAPEHPDRSREMSRVLVDECHEVADERLLAWLAALPDNDHANGYRAATAGAIAVERVRAKNVESARKFLAYAEAETPNEPFYRDIALRGLIPAWSRLGREADATREYAALKTRHDGDAAHLEYTRPELVMIAARCARADLMDALVATDTDFNYEAANAAIVALVADGASDMAFVDRAAAASKDARDDALHLSLLRLALRQERPADYIDWVVRWPTLVGGDAPARRALVEVEKHTPTSIAEVARRVLASDAFSVDTKLLAAAMLHAHAPKDAASWASKAPEVEDSYARTGFLAAPGRSDEAREVLVGITKRTSNDAQDLMRIALVTTDTTLAIDALEACVNYWSYEPGRNDAPLWLDAFGKRDFVDAKLASLHAEIEKRAPKDRSCESYAREVAMVGRTELALAAIAMPLKSKRTRVAQSCMLGFATVGNWTGVMAAFSKVDASPFGARPSAASIALRLGVSSKWIGPRAIPPRALHAR